MIRRGGGETLVMVVHGSEAFDHGDVAWLLDLLEPDLTLVAGVMARTAAEESGLPVTCTDMPPSELLVSLSGRSFLVNRGKTPESGRIFGEMVAGRLAPRKGLVHLEASSRMIYLWNDGDAELASMLAEATGYGIERRRAAPPQKGCRREIRGCLPGEAVFVNGIVIGHATDEIVILEERNGSVYPISGLELKPHGLEKLIARSRVDLSTAWCKSGPIRRRPPSLRGNRREHGRIAMVDHCGHEIYRILTEGNICGVLSIGDDTTAVCGHICCHLGIPVLGIVDGDADGIVEAEFPPGSAIFIVSEGRDDEIGRMVSEMLPCGEVSWVAWRDCILTRLKGKGRIMRYVDEGSNGREKTSILDELNERSNVPDDPTMDRMR